MCMCVHVYVFGVGGGTLPVPKYPGCTLIGSTAHFSVMSRSHWHNTHNQQILIRLYFVFYVM